MLRSEQAILKYDMTRRTVTADRLESPRHDHYLRAAKSLLGIYRQGGGETRQQLHRRVEAALSRLPDCPPRRTAAFCKLLDDQSEYHTNGARARQLRGRVYALGAQLHPVVQQRQAIFETPIADAQEQVAQAIGKPWKEIATLMFADVIELQPLKRFHENLQPDELIDLYNLAQAQACLYRAIRLWVAARQDYKIILRHAKLAGLMHRIERDADGQGYQFLFDGPSSALRETWRYGVRYARLLPKLLSCRQWQLAADVRGPGKQLYRFQLNPHAGLRSQLPAPDEFDSDLEKQIWTDWQAAPPPDWKLQRETEFLHQGQTVFTPDFVLRPTGSSDTIYVELVGYWTPEYLQKKASRLRQFQHSAGPQRPARHWILIFSKRAKQATHLPEQWPEIPWMDVGSRFRPAELVRLATKLLNGECRNDNSSSGR